jgi:hypothetical protein
MYLILQQLVANKNHPVMTALFGLGITMEDDTRNGNIPTKYAIEHKGCFKAEK